MNAWEKPGLTVEERAEALLNLFYVDEADAWRYPRRKEPDLPDALASALRAARRDALEEAAGVLGERVVALESLRRGARLEGNHTYADRLDAQQMEARRCAKSIRTLATSGEEGEK